MKKGQNMNHTSSTTLQFSVVFSSKLNFPQRPRIIREKDKVHSPERVNQSAIITLYKWISYIWLTLLLSH